MCSSAFSTSTTTTTPLLLLHQQQQPWWRRPFLFKNNLSSELSGAVGDLGTFIPILLTLTLVSRLDLSTTLIFTALYNILTGLLFHIPIPVQPMKSIAAVAVSETPHLTPSQIATAGASTAALLFLLGSTRVMSTLYRLLPHSVVRGVQLSQGLSFAFSAINYIRYNQDFVASKSTTAREWLGVDGLILALSCLLFLTIFTGSGHESDDSELRSRSSKRMRIMSSIPSALIFLGIGKLVIGLVFGNSFVRILSAFPIGILGVLLLFAGIELAMASRDMNSKEESFVMLVCAAVSLTGSSAALGFVCGILLFLLLKLRRLECSGTGSIEDQTSSMP